MLVMLGHKTAPKRLWGNVCTLAKIPIPSIVSELIDFLNKSPTSFHATEQSAQLFRDAGFTELSETDSWSRLQPKGKYFFTRNQSAIVAFAVGGRYTPGAGFHMVAAHTDSPCLKLKPISDCKVKAGFIRIGVQPYGGGLWHTWFDRDLTVAGRVILRGTHGSISTRLVHIARPIMRIPTLAIHLDKTVSTDGFNPNTQKHLVPVLATAVQAELERFGCGDGKREAHHPVLLAALAEELGCDTSDIVDFELSVCDTQPSVVAGVMTEFIYGGRLDNLASCFCAAKAMIASTKEGLEEETAVRVVALFDNEEVGSASLAGAGSPMLLDCVRRVVSALGLKRTAEEGVLERSLRRSFLVSADMAHAVHPNYEDKHEENHQPQIHKGLVVKHNANQRYATSALSAHLFQECATIVKVPTQQFVNNNDMGCGSTVGPILAAGMGVRTVDVGIPQLSMHSVREMCGTRDIQYCFEHLVSFFHHFSEVDRQFQPDSRV